MSGHSKWHNIQAKKGKADAARGKIFTKLGRELAVAAKAGADPSTNSKLADAIAKARSFNMPNDNIKKCIAKAAGELSATNYEELTYEGYGSQRQRAHHQRAYRQQEQNGGLRAHRHEKARRFAGQHGLRFLSVRQ